MTYSKKECVFKMTRVFLASFILMGVFLLPYFAYIFGRDIPFSRTILDIGNLMERASFSKIAIVVSNALIFYAAHVGTGVWRLDTLIMAVILCLMYMRTRDVRYCVITHVTCNLLGIFSAYYFV